MRRVKWELEEAAVLVDLYLKSGRDTSIPEREIVKISRLLNKRAICLGKNIDEKFRNTNGIRMQISCVQYVVSDGEKGFSAAAKSFYEAYDLYKTNKEEFDRVVTDFYLKYDTFEPDDNFGEISDDESIYEGHKLTVQVNKYERNPTARRKCIEYHGCRCCICGMDFEDVYGLVGREFIHVHHKKPLYTIRKDYRVDYKNDLIPVCPNCHAMLHRKENGKYLSARELRERMSVKRNEK